MKAEKSPLEHVKSKIVKIEDILKHKTLFEHQTTVFTNGCFDVLHLGHVEYLAKARSMGDLLIIGLNTDKSVKRLKGKNRPIHPENARAMVLASLEFVDRVILFDEDTPYNLIKAISPNILVKGGDYLPENIVGADIVLQNGGKVETIPFVEGYSSSKAIQASEK